LIAWYYYQRRAIHRRSELTMNEKLYSPVCNDQIDMETVSTTLESNKSTSLAPVSNSPIVLSPSNPINEHNMHRIELPQFSSMLTERSSFLDSMNSVRILADVRLSISQRQSSNASHADKRHQIESELIETERSYVNTLRALMNEFVIPIFAQNMIPIRYKEQITSNVPQLIAFHQTLLDKLSTHRRIPAMFIDTSDHFIELYTRYIGDYGRTLDIFSQHRSNKILQAHLSSMRKKKKPLTNILVAPIQRIPRYILLLSELKKHAQTSSKAEIDCALQQITKVCNEIDEKQREIENKSQCLKLSQTLKNLRFDIVKSERKYIDRFIFKRKSDNRQRQFFMFSDVAIIANIKYETKKVVKIKNIKCKLLSDEALSISICDEEEKNENYKGIVLYASVAQNVENIKSDAVAFCNVIRECNTRLDNERSLHRNNKIGLKLISKMSEMRL